MTQTIIPLFNSRSLPIPPRRDASGPVVDTRGRGLRDLRISVTDRCNFRCTYCMPKEVFDADYPYLPHSEVLTFEEIVRLAKIFHGHGIRKIRLTGGEPLLRRNVERLVEMLSAALPDVDLTLTTNGSALKAKARALKAAGLNRITVSLDSLDDATFKSMNDVDFPVANVLEAMDVAATNGWKMDDVIPSAEVVRRINAVLPCAPANPNHIGEVAKRWRYTDGKGEFGIISSVTEAFCGSCNRARLSTDGSIYTCLFAQKGYDLKSLLRGGRSDEEISNAIAAIWQQREDRYSEIRTAETTKMRKVEMSFIGG